MKTKTFFREFYYYFTLLISENHQLITIANYRNCIVYHRHSHILMFNVCNCIIHIYILAVNYTRAMCTIGIKF